MTAATVVMAIVAFEQKNISNRQVAISEKQTELERRVNEAQVGLGFVAASKAVWFKNYGKLAAQNIKVICQHIVASHATPLAKIKTSSEIRTLFSEEIPILPIAMAENPNKDAEFLLCSWTYEGNAIPRTREFVRSGDEPWVLTTQSKVHPDQWKMIEQEYKVLIDELMTDVRGKPMLLDKPGERLADERIP